ncbi:hypothetical protein ACVPOQ_00485 [Staphylococcus aureus]
MEVASAQVKSAILFASLFSKEPTIIKELDVSRNHTETMFNNFSIFQLKQKGYQLIQPLKQFDTLNLHILCSWRYFICSVLYRCSTYHTRK